MRFTIALIFAAAQFGCAVGPKFGPSEILPSEDPLVYIFRTSGFYGVAIMPIVFVNGRQIGKLPAGGYFECRVPPGEVRIGGSTSASAFVVPSAVLGELNKKDVTRLTFTTERGKEYFVRWLPDQEVVLLERDHGIGLIDGSRKQSVDC